MAAARAVEESRADAWKVRADHSLAMAEADGLREKLEALLKEPVGRVRELEAEVLAALAKTKSLETQVLSPLPPPNKLFFLRQGFPWSCGGPHCCPCFGRSS